MPSAGGEHGTTGWGEGDARPGRHACLLSARPRWGGPRAGPGQPPPLQQGVDAGGRVPRTQNKPAFYFQVLLWTFSKVPGGREGAVGKAAGVEAGRADRSEREGPDKDPGA